MIQVMLNMRKTLVEYEIVIVTELNKILDI